MYYNQHLLELLWRWRMALGIILPAFAVGALAIVLYAMVADLVPAVGLLVYLGSSLAACAGMAALVATRRPVRPVEGEGGHSRPPILRHRRKTGFGA